MRHAALRASDRLEVDPEVELLELRGRLFGIERAGTPFEVEAVDRAGLRSVLALADGTRTAADIARELSREYEPQDVAMLCEQLVGSVLRAVVEPGPGATSARAAALAAARVLVIGAGAIAGAAREELARLGFGRVSGVEAGATPGLSARFDRQSLVICALEGVSGRALLDVNAAALASRAPVLFVTMEGGACVVGPLLVPWRSPCFGCSRLSSTLRACLDDAGPQLLPLLRFGALPAGSGRWLAERAAFELGEEALRVVLGEGYPARIGTLLVLAPTGQATVAEISAVTTCPACQGHQRAAILGALAPAPAPEPTPGGAASTSCDDTGGTRSVSPEEAEQRARAALATLGVDLRCEPLPDHAPEALAAIACPYFHGRHTARFSAAGAAVFARFNSSCFGKGTTPVQARCSALFEWLERNLAAWRGDRDLVRASYDEVRERAIDLPFFASGLLPGLPLTDTRRFAADQPIDWVWSDCLRSGRQRLLPARCAYFGGALFAGHALDLPQRGSSGLSAGCSRADAVLQGLLEVVERDAAYTALRCGLVCPAIDADSVHEPASRALLERIVAAGYTPHIRDITSSIGIPVLEATLLRDGEYVHHHAVGYGAHLDPEVALRRALTEAAQSLFFDVSVEASDALRSAASLFEVYPHRKQVLERKGAARRFDELPRLTAGSSVEARIERVVERIAEAIPQADVCALELTPPGLDGVHVVRTFVSGVLDEALAVQRHVPQRCRLVPLAQMYLGRVAQ